MNTDKTNLIDKVFSLVAVGLTFLVPIFFLPTTTEFFEFNKLALLTGAVIFMLVLWGVKIILTKKFSVASSPMDLPMLLAVSVFILSTIFSLNKESSIFGSAGRWFPGLVGFLAMVVYYYAVSSNVKKEETVKAAVYALLASATLSTLISALGYYNKPLNIANSYMFGLTGSITNTIALAVVAAIVAFPVMLKENKRVVKYIATGLITLNVAFALIVGASLGWILLVAGAVLLAAFIPFSDIRNNKLNLNIMAGVLVVLALMLVVPTTNKLLVNKDYPDEATLPISASWIVASSAIRDFPLLGSGPSTFYLNYTRYKPLGMNNTNDWLTRFDKPYNEVFNILGTLGLIGTAIMVFLGVTLAKFVSKTRGIVDSNGAVVALGLGVMLSLGLMLLTYSTAVSSFLLFTFAALLVARANTGTDLDIVRHVSLSFTSISTETSLSSLGTVKKEYFHYVVSLPVFALALAGAMFTYKVYLAEVYMRKAVVEAQNNNASGAYQYTANAINTNPRRDTYQNVYAQINLAIANNLAKKQDLSDTDKQTIQSLIAQAIRSSRVSTEVLNPLNAGNWEVRAGIYRSLIGAAQNADQWTVSALNNAIQLDPTNPKLRLDLGGIYYAKEDYLSAGNQFRQAAVLKPDYANAHYNFAQALNKLKDYKSAKTELETAMNLVNKESDDYKKVSAELDALKAMPDVAGAASDKPTVEPITQNTGIPQQPTTTKQEPLNKATDVKQPETIKDAVKTPATTTQETKTQ